MEVFERMQAFELAFQNRVTDIKIDHRWGRAYFNDEVPLKYDFNFMRIDGNPSDVTAGELTDLADRLFAPRGLGHRRILVSSESLGHELASPMEAHDYVTTRFLWMVHRHEPERESRFAARELDAAVHIATKDIFNRREPYVPDEETARQLRRAEEIVVQRTARRGFGVDAGGVIAAIAELYSDGTTAQIEDVATLEEHRGKGLATAVVLAALRAAQAARHELIFLVADEADWPKQMYRKLGFEEVGTTYQFIRFPEGHPGF